MIRYKLALKVLVVFLFAAPVFWIVLDPAGQRWADVTLLRLLGNPEINLDYSGLSGNESVDDIRKTYPKLDLVCDAKGPDVVAELNQNCFGQIAAVNQLPARYLTFYFRDGRLYRIKLSYRAAYHEILYQQLTKVYGKPVTSEMGGQDHRVIQWQTGPGVVVMKAVVSKKGDNQLFWLTPGYEPPTGS